MIGTLSRPLEKTMALGGVAIGSMKANEAAIPAGSSRYEFMFNFVDCVACK